MESANEADDANGANRANCDGEGLCAGSAAARLTISRLALWRLGNRVILSRRSWSSDTRFGGSTVNRLYRSYAAATGDELHEVTSWR